jgi:ADP-ribosylglycohydrolase
MFTALPNDYEERVYAGILGKIIGVYLGRPFEGWSNQRIEAELGEIWYYVHEKLGQPLIVTDDDISGTFTFVRAFPDFGNSYDVTAEQIGSVWLNYLIENKTVLWWGGMGVSTEHTAYLRLKSGIKAPDSGSSALNGRIVSEQIGSQIFIDAWAMLCPGDPEKAAALALKAASVSHDGEAIFGAQIIAALEAQAFVESDLNRLLDNALTFIPRASIIYALISDVRRWHSDEPRDWRKTFEKIKEKYGYQHFGGGCHMVPNHAVIILALL